MYRGFCTLSECEKLTLRLVPLQLSGKKRSRFNDDDIAPVQIDIPGSKTLSSEWKKGSRCVMLNVSVPRFESVSEDSNL